jgi:alkanesulfonate monooxygenase SsuD/methylene tetrahydromethanopterin reductase-like flavin-dependent oxidoreductase (luciferase family)
VRVGYLLDTSIGPVGQPRPSAGAAAAGVDALLAEAREAIDAGFDSIVVPERHMRTDCHAPDALSLLTILAAETKDVFLGTCATVLTLHNPMEFAERIAMLDLISKGRVFVTLARGFNRDYWRMFGLTDERLSVRFRESLDVVKAAWRGEPFSYSGETMKLDDVRLTPPPFQDGGPPIWIGAHHPRAIARAGEFADGWVGGFFPFDRDEWQQTVGEYRANSERTGNAGLVAMVRAGYVAEDRHQAVQTLMDTVQSDMSYYLRRPGMSAVSADVAGDVATVRRHLVAGNPDDCVNALRWYRDELDVDYIFLRIRFPDGPGLSSTRDAIRMFGSEVLPRVQTPRQALKRAAALPNMSPESSS